MGKLTVGLRATGVVLLVAGCSVPVLLLARPRLPSPLTVESGLTFGLGVVLLGCWAWLGLTASLMAVETVATGSSRRSARLAPSLVRTLVSAACGVGLAGTVAAPALADAGDSLSGVYALDGLRLPDRTLGGMPRRRPTGTVVTVRRGDSLWKLAQRLAPEGAENRWVELYLANRPAVGPDPDLIRPGMRLAVPHQLAHTETEDR